MSALLIRLGKAFSILRQDGLLVGGKRVAQSFRALFSRVKPGDILFIASGVGDSARYRSRHGAEELRLQGFSCSVTVQDNPWLPQYAEQFKIFIFQRTLVTPAVEKLIARIKEQKKEIIFETDDLVFDPQYLQGREYFEKMNPLEKKLYAGGVGGAILKDPYVKVCTTTNAYLAEKLKEYNKQVFIVPNKLSSEDLKIVEKIQNSKFIIHNSIKIGYFSGTSSHDQDFATITEALVKMLEKYPQVRLVLAGPLKIGAEFECFSDRIERRPFASREKHLENIAGVAINLAPLEIGNPFCESKSELKFVEAGALGVPTIASATQTFQEAILDGLDGFVAKDTEEWENKLERLILSPELREDMGQKVKEKVLQKYATSSAKNEEYYAYLRSKLG